MEWARRRTRPGTLGFLAYQAAPEWLLPPARRPRAARAVQLLLPGERREGAAACLGVLEILGYRRLARALAAPPWAPLFALGYWAAAARRGFLSRFLSRDPARCREGDRIPDPPRS